MQQGRHLFLIKDSIYSSPKLKEHFHLDLIFDKGDVDEHKGRLMKNDDNGTKSQSRFNAFMWRRGDNLLPRISKLIVFSLSSVILRHRSVKQK